MPTKSRPRAGRPALSDGASRAHNVRIPDDEWAAVEAEAEALGETTSTIVRAAISSYLAGRGERLRAAAEQSAELTVELRRLARGAR